MNYRYRGNTELPAIPIAWLDNTGAVVDFSTGWTFTAYICDPAAPSVALVAKTSGITGAQVPDRARQAPSQSLSALQAFPASRGRLRQT